MPSQRPRQTRSPVRRALDKLRETVRGLSETAQALGMLLGPRLIPVRAPARRPTRR